MKVGDLVKYWGYTDEENDTGLITGLIKSHPRQVVVQWFKYSQLAYFTWEEFESLLHNDIEVISEGR